MLEPDWKAYLKERGLRVPAGVFVPAGSDPARLDRLAPPLVLKAVSPQIVHKTDVGAVRVGIASAEGLARELEAMRARLAARGLWPIDGFLVEEMVPPGLELLVGMVEDARWGRLLVLGSGGVAAEALAQIRFAALPLRRGDVATLLTGLPWLRQAVARFGAERWGELEELLWTVGGPGGIAVDPRLQEWEINPLVANGAGLFALDVRGAWAPGEGS